MGRLSGEIYAVTQLNTADVARATRRSDRNRDGRRPAVRPGRGGDHHPHLARARPACGLGHGPGSPVPAERSHRVDSVFGAAGRDSTVRAGHRAGDRNRRRRDDGHRFRGGGDTACRRRRAEPGRAARADGLPDHCRFRPRRDGRRRRRRADHRPRGPTRARSVRLPHRPRPARLRRAIGDRGDHRSVRDDADGAQGGADRRAAVGGGGRVCSAESRSGPAGPSQTSTSPMEAAVVDRRRGGRHVLRVGDHRTARRRRRLGDHHRPHCRRHGRPGELLPMVERRRGAVCAHSAVARPADRDQHRAAVAASAQHPVGGGHVVCPQPRRARRGAAGDRCGADAGCGLSARHLAAVQPRDAAGVFRGLRRHRGPGARVAGAWPGGAGLPGPGRRAHHPDQPDRCAGSCTDHRVRTPAGRGGADSGADSTAPAGDRAAVELHCHIGLYRDLRRPDLGCAGHRNQLAQLLRTVAAVVRGADPIRLPAPTRPAGQLREADAGAVHDRAAADRRRPGVATPRPPRGDGSATGGCGGARAAAPRDGTVEVVVPLRFGRRVVRLVRHRGGGIGGPAGGHTGSLHRGTRSSRIAAAGRGGGAGVRGPERVVASCGLRRPVAVGPGTTGGRTAEQPADVGGSAGGGHPHRDGLAARPTRADRHPRTRGDDRGRLRYRAGAADRILCRRAAAAVRRFAGDDEPEPDHVDPGVRVGRRRRGAARRRGAGSGGTGRPVIGVRRAGGLLSRRTSPGPTGIRHVGSHVGQLDPRQPGHCGDHHRMVRVAAPGTRRRSGPVDFRSHLRCQHAAPGVRQGRRCRRGGARFERAGRPTGLRRGSRASAVAVGGGRLRRCPRRRRPGAHPRRRRPHRRGGLAGLHRPAVAHQHSAQQLPGRQRSGADQLADVVPVPLRAEHRRGLRRTGADAAHGDRISPPVVHRGPQIRPRRHLRRTRRIRGTERDPEQTRRTPRHRLGISAGLRGHRGTGQLLAHHNSRGGAGRRRHQGQRPR